MGPRGRWLHRLGVVLVAALAVVFLTANRSQGPAAWRAARGADPVPLAAAAALSLARLAGEGQMQRVSQRSLGLDLGRASAVRLGAAAHFLNAIVKSGGMAGLAAYSGDAHRRQASQGRVAVAYVVAMAVGDLALALSLVAGVALTSATGRFSGAMTIATAVFAVYLGGRLALIAYGSRSPANVERLLALPHRILARLEVGRHSGPSFETVTDEAFEALSSLRRRPSAALPILAWAVGLQLLGAAQLGAVLGSLDGARGADVALAGYSLGLLFGIVGLLPSGAGSTDLSLGVVLVSFGSTVGQAAAAVALYRLVELWLPVAVGAAAARGLLHRGA
ncbi:MAG: lysylphosphatidylglycerol synthase domain-containing protein [Acidimicrobiales bacterium]